MAVSVGQMLLHALAVVTLAAATVLTVSSDGGFETTTRWTLPLLVVAATPMVVVELFHVRRTAQMIVAALGFGIVVNAFAASFRGDFPLAAATLLLLVATAMATHRLMRTRWGPVLVAGLVALTLVRFFELGASGYMGRVWSDSVARWLPLSWHNQSAVLMAAPAVFCISLAAGLSRRSVALGAGVIGALGLGSVWLTGSRGGMISAAVGVLVLVVMARTRRGLFRAGAAIVGAVIVASAFTAAAQTSGGYAVADRAGTATTTAQLRFDHWRAGLRMLVEEPITGFGLGSYGAIAPQFAPPQTPITTFAHNEIVEHLAEGGAILGFALIAAFGATAWAIVARAVALPEEGLTSALSRGGAAMVAVLATHALIDFDWAYPVLVALLGIGVGLVMTPRTALAVRSKTPVVAGVMVALAVALAGTAALVDRNPGLFGLEQSPLAVALQRTEISELLAADDPVAALDSSRVALAWHPADTTLVTLQRIAQAELGHATPDDVVATLSPGRSRLSAYALAAEWLYDRGELERAVELADELSGLVNTYAAWQPDPSAETAWEIKFLVAESLDGCDGVRAVFSEFSSDPYVGGDATRFDTAEVSRRCLG